MQRRENRKGGRKGESEGIVPHPKQKSGCTTDINVLFVSYRIHLKNMLTDHNTECVSTILE